MSRLLPCWSRNQFYKVGLKRVVCSTQATKYHMLVPLTKYSEERSSYRMVERKGKIGYMVAMAVKMQGQDHPHSGMAKGQGLDGPLTHKIKIWHYNSSLFKMVAALPRSSGKGHTTPLPQSSLVHITLPPNDKCSMVKGSNQKS